MNQETSNNSEVIYGYTESLLKLQGESLNRLDTKMSAFLALAGILLRFAINLPGKEKLAAAPEFACYTCLSLQVTVCVFATVAALVSGVGLTARPRGGVAGPEELMEESLYELDKETFRCIIINTWVQTEKEYKSLGRQKGGLLNWSIGASCAAIAAFALDVILSCFYL